MLLLLMMMMMMMIPVLIASLVLLVVLRVFQGDSFDAQEDGLLCQIMMIVIDGPDGRDDVGHDDVGHDDVDT